jgi:hypothetical protein
MAILRIVTLKYGEERDRPVAGRFITPNTGDERNGYKRPGNYKALRLDGKAKRYYAQRGMKNSAIARAAKR